MPKKQTSENELVVSARAAAVPTRRKPATATRKPRPASKVAPAAASPAPAAPVAQVPTYQQIAQLAYTLWQARGCQGGSPEADWLQAEQQLLARA